MPHKLLIGCLLYNHLIELTVLPFLLLKYLFILTSMLHRDRVAARETMNCIETLLPELVCSVIHLPVVLFRLVHRNPPADEESKRDCSLLFKKQLIFIS